ncbi:MAG: HD domain-containing phosphohydrolase [Trueperaceae bacterium]
MPPTDRYHAAFANAFDAILITRPDGTILDANPSACRLFGLRRAELVRLGRSGVVDPSDPRLSVLLRKRETHGHAHGELRMRRGDGSTFEAEIASVLYDGPDGVPETSIVVRDRTARIDAKRQRAWEYATLLERIGELAERVGAATDTNAVYRALFQFAHATTPARALLVAHYDAERDVRVAAFAAGIADGAYEESDVSALPPGGMGDQPHARAIRDRSPIVIDDLSEVAARFPSDRLGSDAGSEDDAPPLSAAILPMTVLDESIGVFELQSTERAAFRPEHLGPLALAADLAAIATKNLRLLRRERRARRDAEGERHRLHDVIEQAPAMMATAEGPDHVFTHANRRYRQTLGLGEDVVGRSVREVLPEVEAQGIGEILDRVRASGEPFVADNLPMHLNVRGVPTTFHFDLVYQPLRDGEGTVTGVLAHVIDVSPLVHANERLERLAADLEEAYDRTIEGWGRALDLKDAETAGHSQRVTTDAVRLGRRMGLSEADLRHLRRGALLHDIGKMGVPDRILLKPGALDADEWRIMQSHTSYGADLLKPIAFLEQARDVPRHHHERWDGGGYPDRLAGEAIPRLARIFAVVDVYDALTSDRPYRAAWTAQQALAHLREQAGQQFDPDVINAFLAMQAEDGGAPASEPAS